MIKIVQFLLLAGVFFSSLCFAQKNDIELEKEIVIVSASRNNKKYYERNLQSTLNQNYKNYRIIWIDDASPDGTGSLVEEYLKKHDLTGKVTLIKNEVRIGSMENFYRAVNSCKDTDVIVIVDGDDWFTDDNALQVVNKAYQDASVWLTYGDDKPFVPRSAHYSYEIPKNIIETNSIRSYVWVTGHLKTFYAWLFKCINIEDLKYKNEFAPSCTDQTMMLPMVEMAAFHTKFINKVLYVHNNENELSEENLYSDLSRKYVAYLRSLKKYEPLEKAPEFLK